MAVYEKTKSTDCLSYDYRINCSADDVTGLAISPKMRADICGCNQCSQNIQDDFSIIHVAEGALHEIPIYYSESMNYLSQPIMILIPQVTKNTFKERKTL